MSSPVQSLRSVFEDIRGRLEAAQLSDDPGLKAELMAIYRSVNAEFGELSQLKDDMRQFVERWKAHNTGIPVVASGNGVAASGNGSAHPGNGFAAPLHEDRLGASTFTEKAWTRISQGEYVDAEQLLVQALELSPRHVEAQTLLGWAQMRQHKLDTALMNLQDVLSREPNNALARINVGYVCLKKGIFGEAIEHLSHALKQAGDPRSKLYGNYYLGLVYIEREMYEDASVFFERAITIGPSLVEAYYELGHAYWLGGRREQALSIWTRGGEVNRYSSWRSRCIDLLAMVERGEIPTRGSLNPR